MIAKWAILAWIVFSLCYSAYMHGKVDTDVRNFWTALVAWILIGIVLYSAGALPF
jgi:hypothetical protein